MTRNSNRKAQIRARMAMTQEPYSVAAHYVDQKTVGIPVSIGEEECPGYFTWSAFGATYPDTVCASVVEFSDGYQGWGLCDADDGFRDKGIPCPFCDSAGFLYYQHGGSYRVPYWDGTDERVASHTEIHFHEKGSSLWMSATHPEHGELRVTIHDEEEEGSDMKSFIPWVLSNGDEL